MIYNGKVCIQPLENEDYGNIVYGEKNYAKAYIENTSFLDYRTEGAPLRNKLLIAVPKNTKIFIGDLITVIKIFS